MKILTIKEIAENCKLSQKTIRRQIASGILKANQLGNQWRILEEDFNSWLNQGYKNSKKFTHQNQLKLFDLQKREKRNNSKKPLLYVDEVNWLDVSKYWEKKFTSKYNFVDLFAGAGGLSLGLEQAGFEGIAAVEHERFAVETYNYNFKHPVIFDDICRPETKMKLYEIVDEFKTKHQANEVDVIGGGFPCQGFSMSGYRVIDDSRNSLYKEMLEIVGRIKPRFVIMENVVGLRSMHGGKVEEKIINDYLSIGYKINVTVLCAADYFVPQKRNRVIFIGNRIGQINYHPKPILKEGEYLTTKSAIEDLIEFSENDIFNHVPTVHSKSMQERLINVKEGDSLYPNYSDAWKKCPWDGPSCTIKENHGGVNIHPRLPRVLTAREMARLQSFPDSFLFKGSKKWQLVQIGNAVPPLLARAIGLSVRKSLDGE